MNGLSISRFAWLRNERVRLALLLAVLTSLAGYVAASRAGLLHDANGSPVGLEGCPADAAPSEKTISRAQLRGLRESLRRTMSFDRSIRPYEEGVTTPRSAWSDSGPGSRAALPLRSPEPGGYEMRWWMPNRDDVVADALVFADERRAHDFFVDASGTQCRQASSTRPAAFPPGGRNLEWRNPEGFAQEDLFLLRGRRVYRVVVVKAGGGGGVPSYADRIAAFSLVDNLACALPRAGCNTASS